MPLAGDQQQVGHLDPGSEHKPFRVSVRTAAGRERPELFGAALSLLRGR